MLSTAVLGSGISAHLTPGLFSPAITVIYHLVQSVRCVSSILLTYVQQRVQLSPGGSVATVAPEVCGEAVNKQ